MIYLIIQIQICYNELDTEEESMENRVLYKHKPKDETFKITRDDTGAYVVSGPGIERAFLMTDFNRDASVRRFAQPNAFYGCR